MDLMLANLSGVRLRRKIHSSLGGRKAYLHFELKDAHRSRLLPRSAFKIVNGTRNFLSLGKVKLPSLAGWVISRRAGRFLCFSAAGRGVW
ncbi:MAG TPA: hypothetical protein VLZ74_07035, partial [Methylocella sp.]|nr:hypothetical protein [Methylocella sp.]